jgi:hypothetical protein
MAQVDSGRSVISEFGSDPGPIRVGFVVDGGALGPRFLIPNTWFFPLTGSVRQYLNVFIVDAI